MRQNMNEALLKEQMAQKLSERVVLGDRLLESKWLNAPIVGEGLSELYTESPEKARNVAFALSMQEAHMNELTETQISSTFQTSPENLLRVVRLGYPNSVKGEIFTDYQMETAKDSIYYLSPVYSASKRGAVAGEVTHESSSYRFASEIEQDAVSETPDGAVKTFTVDIANVPLRPFTIKVLVDEEVVAVDNGAGSLVGAKITAGTVNYTSGAVSVTLVTAPVASTDVIIESNYDSEDASNYEDLGHIELQLKDYQFRVKPYPLAASWSKMTELLLGTSFNIEAEEALVGAAADELKKSLDFLAIKEGYRGSKKNDVVNFDATGAVGESEVDRAMAVSRAINNASDTMFDKVQRGGVTKIVGGPSAVSYLQLHRRFNAGGKQPMVGAHRVGSLDGVDIYKAPKTIIPTDELLCVYKNEQNKEDVAVINGTLVPLFKTNNMEFKQRYTETGLAHYGDIKTLQPSYLVRIKIANL